MGFNFQEMYVVNSRGQKTYFDRKKFSEVLANFFSLPPSKRQLIW